MKLSHLFAISIAAATVGCGGGEDPASTASTPNFGQNGAVSIEEVSMDSALSCEIPDFAQKLLAAINTVRSQSQNCGGHAIGPTAPLSWNLLLAGAASGHSIDMANEDFFSNVGSDDLNYPERINKTGYKADYTGESLALINGSLTKDNIIPRAIAGWLNETANCAAIKSSVFDEAGGACVMVGKKAYITLNLGGS